MDVRIIGETTAETGENRMEELLCLGLIDQCHGELGRKRFADLLLPR